MKPCDCRMISDINRLECQGLSFNSRSIGIDSTGVILTIDPYARIKVDHKNFKRFAKWYLEDQEPLTQESTGQDIKCGCDHPKGCVDFCDGDCRWKM